MPQKTLKGQAEIKRNQRQSKLLFLIIEMKQSAHIIKEIRTNLGLTCFLSSDDQLSWSSCSLFHNIVPTRNPSNKSCKLQVLLKSQRSELGSPLLKVTERIRRVLYNWWHLRLMTTTPPILKGKLHKFYFLEQKALRILNYVTCATDFSSG